MSASISRSLCPKTSQVIDKRLRASIQPYDLLEVVRGHGDAKLDAPANTLKWNDRAYADLGKHILSGHISSEVVAADVLDLAFAAVFADEVFVWTYRDLARPID